MTNDDDIRHTLRGFIQNNFLIGRTGRGVEDGDSLLGAGLVDSTGVLEMVGFIEETWSLSIPDDDMRPENLDSVDALTAYLHRRLEVRP